jgi:hypothetical protein
MSAVKLELEDDLLALLRKTDTSLEKAAREMIVLELYRRGIALAQVDQLPLLERLFGEILVPPAVVREVGLSLRAFVVSASSPGPCPPPC